MGKEKQKYKKHFYGYLIVSVLLLAITVFIVIFYTRMDRELNEIEETKRIYDKYYAVVFVDERSEYEETLLQGVIDTAEDENALVKEIGEELSFDLTREEKLDLAILAKVDGIIVQGDNSEELKSKIEEAEEQGIPVITIMEDCIDSARKSFVGNSRYEIGRTFARQVIDVANAETNEIFILNSGDMVEENDLFFSGFKETMANEGNHLSPNISLIEIGEHPFEAEEKMQEILCDEETRPDILLVLDEENTNASIQILLDYNIAGDVKVIGFASSSLILDAIQKGVIYSSVYVNPYETGKNCVQVFNELETSGYVNNFKTVEVFVINQNNIKNYMEEATHE